MARLAGLPQETFVAMEHIRETALVRFDSLFTPERKLWSQHNLQRFHALFVERFDEGEGTFLEKFRKQLEAADDDILQLAAELLYVQQFFTSLTGVDKKIENVQTVLNWRTHAVQIPEWAVAGIKRGLAGDQSFNQHRPFHLAWLNEFLIHWNTLADTTRSTLLNDPWRFAQEVRGVEYSIGAYHQPMREAWLYLVFPDSFENISSRRDKKLIRQAFKDRLPNGPTENIDADLLTIRNYLTSQEGEGFHFYRSPVIERWQREKKKPKQGKSAVATMPKGYLAGGTTKVSEPPQPGGVRFDDLETLGTELFLDPPEALREWADLLLDTRQVIFQGPPGTGKTFIARQLLNVAEARNDSAKHALGFRATPHFFFLRPDGSPVSVMQGVLPIDSLRRALDGLLLAASAAPKG